MAAEFSADAESPTTANRAAGPRSTRRLIERSPQMVRRLTGLAVLCLVVVVILVLLKVI